MNNNKSHFQKYIFSSATTALLSTPFYLDHPVKNNCKMADVCAPHKHSEMELQISLQFTALRLPEQSSPNGTIIWMRLTLVNLRIIFRPFGHLGQTPI